MRSIYFAKILESELSSGPVKPRLAARSKPSPGAQRFGPTVRRGSTVRRITYNEGLAGVRVRLDRVDIDRLAVAASQHAGEQEGTEREEGGAGARHACS